MTRPPVLVKICGLRTAESLAAALDAGADMVGFVFFGPSPRNIALSEAASLARGAKGRARKVALTVDADDAFIDAIARALDPDVLQLHGRETPARAAALSARTGKQIMKAIGVSGKADLGTVAAFADVCDWLLLDAKPPKDATRPGGNGLAFDWSILDGFDPGKPWLLSGGLNAANVADALARTHAPGVDVSSGVESAPGVKDAAAISAFVKAARGLSPAVARG
ncbi:MAG TPA: phosphoribosylanthranilate isomerase [Rhodoblastus sp.]|nr:phosphoribosylanthranilate isomerase [Rhodoblastus sp.]